MCLIMLPLKSKLLSCGQCFLFFFFILLSLSVYFSSVTCSNGLPWWFIGKNPPTNAGDTGSVPGSGRCPGERNDNPRQ